MESDKYIDHSDWEDLKITNPDKYRQLSRNAIMERQKEVLPDLIEWFGHDNIFPKYENSLPNLATQLSKLDFSLYDTGLSGKFELTDSFIDACFGYDFENIINIAESFDEDKEWKIKNLINRSYKYCKNFRKDTIRKLIKNGVLTESQCQEVEILHFIPIKNHIIGIEWIENNFRSWSVKEIVRSWEILLSLDESIFTDTSFIKKLKRILGDRRYTEVIECLLINAALKPKTIKIYKYFKIKYPLAIKGIIERSKTHLIESGIPIRDLIYDGCNLHYNGYCMRIESNYKLKITSKDIYVTLLFKKQETQLDFDKGIRKNGAMKLMFEDDFDIIFEKLRDASFEIASNPKSYKKETTKKKSKVVNHNEKEDENTHKIGEFNPDLNISDKIQEKKDIFKTIRDTTEDVSYKESIISSEVKASDLEINVGYIKFGDYYLRSGRIKSKVHQSILSKISHTFTLVKDNAVYTTEIIEVKGNKKKKGKTETIEKKELRFYFKPGNDLSYLLAEIEELKKNKPMLQNTSYPQTGIFDLPWDYVTFYDGIMYLAHPNPSMRATLDPFCFRHTDILKSYRDILSYIKERCPKFRVKAIDGRIEEILNFTDFKQQIKHFHDFSTAEVEEIPGFSINSKRSEYSVEYFSKSSKVKKSPFLNYLCMQQIKDRNIFAVTESAVHDSSYFDKDESGYLFTIRQMHGVSTILFENASDSSRSSIVFKVSTDRYEEAIREIKDFLASDIKNKRQKLTYGKINFKNPAILSYGRVMHRDYYSWVEHLLYFL